MTTTQLQLRRDTTANIAAVTPPAQGELVFDVTRNAIVLGDGATAGGRPGPAIGANGSVTSKGPTAAPAGGSASTVNLAGIVSFQNTPTGNTADTTEDVLQTTPLPANVFGATGGAKVVVIRAEGRCAGNADNKTIRLYFGSEVIATPTAATNGKNWWLELRVSRTGASTQRVVGTGQVDVTPVTPLSTTGAETETGAITIKCTGQAGTANANDIICDAMTVEVLN